MDLFETLGNTTGSVSITDIKDLSSEFASTMACCEEGACCAEPM